LAPLVDAHNCKGKRFGERLQGHRNTRSVDEGEEN